ncbi:polymer-forming cytoskeletal protein [Myxococcota bacterium]|nr:polymer-forming cytoskeletal protein [Myxococcota bacterium]
MSAPIEAPSARPATVARTVRVRGDVACEGPLSIEGELDGTIDADDVVIEAGARVRATIRAGRITIRGHASGELVAREVIRLAVTASVDGALTAPTIVIEDGARFQGTVQMDVALPEGVTA